jgi:hypothetical protein
MVLTDVLNNIINMPTMTELVSWKIGQSAISSAKLANKNYCLQCDETCQGNLWYAKFISSPVLIGVWWHRQLTMYSVCVSNKLNAVKWLLHSPHN